jgi:predicted dehydrogenase
VLLLDASWHGLRTLEFACQRKKPTFIAASLGSDADRLRRIYETSRAEGLTLMPEMSRRHAPSTVRLHELMATQLGRPMRIVIEAEVPRRDGSNADATNSPIGERDAEFLLGLIDWCRYVVRSPVQQVELSNSFSAASNDWRGPALILRFAPPRAQAAAPTAELRLREPDNSNGMAVGDAPVRYDVECERGCATIVSPVELRWQTNGNTVSETLTSDRPDVEVLIDHFCRRALGGLIPVPDISDVCRGLEVISAARRSIATGAAVSLNGRA